MNPTLYQINTRVWRHRFGPETRLLDIPQTYWQWLADEGVDYVWLMGVWRTVREAVPRYALTDGLKKAYAQALPDWTEADLIGSPYAIDRYELAPELGDGDTLRLLRRRLRQAGLKLILDFVPNHFHAETSYLEERPEVFLRVEEAAVTEDSSTFYAHAGGHWAHGKDPNYAAWTDTVQVDYAKAEARAFMEAQLLHVAQYCDGVRCDMAMLLLNDVFARTWGSRLPKDRPTEEFWPGAIALVRETYPDFLFIAEVYWGLEWELQQQGFDYTYDKRLLDRLLAGDPTAIRAHLEADHGFQQRSMRFLENHDEARSARRLDTRQIQALAIASYTLPGLRFFYDGQWEGRRERLPVQLGRERVERPCECPWSGQWDLSDEPRGVRPICACLFRFYEKLRTLLRDPALREGTWQLLPPHTEVAMRRLLAWTITRGKERMLVLINWSGEPLDTTWPVTDWTEATSWLGENRYRPEEVLVMYPYQHLILRLGELAPPRV